MLFNSFEFIFGFVPVFFVGLILFARWNSRLVVPWLTSASLLFYAWWDARYLLLLGLSIAVNFTFVRLIIGRSGSRSAKHLLIAALVANLAVLFFYKYFDFFSHTVNTLANTRWPELKLVLPLGISFFTFTQIAFLVDASRGEVSQVRWLDYMLFVLYFPHLIAGPILHHKEMMPQFTAMRTFRPRWTEVGSGLALFMMGLGKKILIADTFARYATPMFSAAAEGSAPMLIGAWSGAIAYTLQLYFDFSGYCDMAAGISIAMGIRLPINFNSPYKACSLIDFWRRWHITLSRFLRDYLYFPLGGNRRGPTRRHINLFLTMMLGGLWHGAHWTFVVWGAWHGVGLMINHVWRNVDARIARQSTPASRSGGWLLTMTWVVVSWVVFRADSVGTAGSILWAMAGGNGIDTHIDRTLISFTLLGAVLIALPNSNELLARYSPVLDSLPRQPGSISLQWKWGVVAALLFVACLLLMGRQSEFLYFQF